MESFSKEFRSFTVNSSDPKPSYSISLDSYQESSPDQFRQSPFAHRLGRSPSPAFEGDSPGSNDSFSATLKFISEVLLEEEEQEAQQQVAERSLFYTVESDSNTLLGNDSIHEAQQPVFQFRAAKSTSIIGQKEKRNNRREFGYGINEEEEEEGRRNKQLALYSGDYTPTEMFDKELLWDGDSDDLSFLAETLQSIDQNHNQHNNNEESRFHFVSLLTQCAQAVEANDSAASNRLLREIRRRSSPTGDPTQRLAHYFANGLEARLFGGPVAATQFTPIATAEMSSADVLKAYQLHISTCPFFRMSVCYANSTIRKLAVAAPRIHIIDFGIMFGFQWPGLIQRLSQRPGGPPTLRITGVELPQTGFRPAEKVEETRRRLMDYCTRFGVPAELNVIARRWEEVRYEELGVRGDEVVVANCMNRMRHVSDEAACGGSGVSPRDAVLGLIRRARPEVFIHGVVSGAYNAPGLAERVRGAAGHFAALFEAMEEAGAGRGDRHREMFERAVYGRYLENAVACEGAARVERPETYKEWEVRNSRAGFRQVGLDRVIFDAVKKTVSSSYNEGFTVEQDGQWLVQGWKGRRLYALSCWKPL